MMFIIFAMPSAVHKSIETLKTTSLRTYRLVTNNQLSKSGEERRKGQSLFSISRENIELLKETSSSQLPRPFLLAPNHLLHPQSNRNSHNHRPNRNQPLHSSSSFRAVLFAHRLAFDAEMLHSFFRG